ncbi:related to vesicular integral-membrane protein VIP36 [Ramularia collo-cygni]|uniref:Related to vesicular integral-membrane protein VIP36 n=1 Tax=Ramularia collo-cygni TaxID=112498 RepID=A0A2D3V5W2_9PEZI|nr:related to vesicular integral-membrane protein VIP36 [Ramularia collo-cygni]CZT25692.1 related to vesicular integral-membrane protein VIP36 [Ramularia collo-cygni]
MAFQPGLWLVTILLAAWSCVVAAEESDIKSIALRTHSLQMPYLDSDMQSRWWDFGGTTVVRADQYIRLSGQHPSSAGWIFSRVPLTATNWEIEVEFKISGTGSLFGDGMAMWITKERAEMGTVFGMKDRFEGLGIFFDTYKNNRPGVVFPYVMAMLGDGQTSYDQANDGKSNELVAGCSARGIRNPDFPTKAKVRYFQDKSLTVDLMYKKEDEWTRCFEAPNVKLPSVTYLGFSAETGELADNHDIIKVETNNLYSPSGSTGSSSGTKDKNDRKSKKNKPITSAKEGGSWMWFFFKFIIFGVLVAGGYVGWTAYRARTRDRF